MFRSAKLLGLCLIVLVLIFLVPQASDATNKAPKRPLTHEDYDSWKSIGRAYISVDGGWVLYLEVPQDGEADLVVKNLKTNKVYRHTIGYSGEGTDSERAARPELTHQHRKVRLPLFLSVPSYLWVLT